MSKSLVMVGLGELLWDFLPSGKALGGAPANFAYMASMLGDQGIVASRVGIDRLGHEAGEVLERHGLTTKFLQQDGQHDTGAAEVRIDRAGQPTFTIKQSVSWDFLQWTEPWEELSRVADVICFGSLAQRSPESAETIDNFLRNTRSETLRICDVNLRQSFYSTDVLRRSFQHANIIKLTDKELHRVSSLLLSDAEDEEILAKALLREWDLRLVCITRGARGSVLVSENKTVEHKGFPVKVVDTVGAGDAFTACLAHHLIRDRTLEEISEYANQFASWIATQAGATPAIDLLQSQKFKAFDERATITCRSNSISRQTREERSDV